jgi:AcrR family transcriptional regulator
VSEARKSRRRPAPVRRKLPQTERSADTVAVILMGVERVLERHGPGGLTTNRVAEVAGVSIGTLYQYFSNKESLIAALQDRYFQHTVGFCRAVLANAHSVPMPMLVERMAAALVEAYAGQRPIHQWLVELRSAAGFHARWREEVDKLTADLAAFVEARTDLQIPDPRATAFVLVHSIEGVINAAAERDHRLDVPAIADAMTAMLSCYLTRS